MAAAGLSAVGSMMSALASQQDTSSKEGFETQKKFSIAQAIFSMLSGIIAVWPAAMQLGPIAGPIFGAIQSAAIAALGGVQIDKIKKTQFNGSSAATPSSGAIGNLVAPVQYTSDVQGASFEDALKD